MGRRGKRWMVLALAAACPLAAAACTGSANGTGSSAGNVSPVKGLDAVTPTGTRPVSSVVWATTRDPRSLDAIYSYGYPENTADTLMCESLLRQAPDGSLEPGLATVANPNPTTVVFTLRPGVKFWDGHPVTSADVVYSLERSANPKLGGLYTWVFDRVVSIEATGPAQVTIKLKQSDYWLEGELSSMAGVIIERSFAEKEGANYGTPAGSIMCTGAYMLKSWTPGVGVVAVRNPHYWNPSVHPLVGQITIKGIPQIASLTSGLLTGAIQGYYVANGGLPTLDQLMGSSTVRVYQSLGWQSEVFFVSSLKGVLGNLNVRRALSLALNRQAIINSVYHGAALLPRWLSNPGTFGYGTSVFDQAYDSSPVLTQNIAEAKRLVQQAGAVGKTITIGTSSLSDIAELTGAYQAAAQAIGLKVVLRSVPAQDYIEFFADPKFRVGVDGFVSVGYGDYAAPEAMLAQAVLPGGLQNFDNFNDPQITAALDQARSTANLDKRAALVVEAEKLTVQQLPWIPDVQPTNVLLLSKGLTGAVASLSYLFAPWANQLGGTG
jgi:peptide/nickel transport system substrate-binding protein